MGSLTGIVVFVSVIGLGQPGTSVMPVLKIEQGVRLAAMGGSGIGAVDDASAIYWNPAGLGRELDNCFAISHHQWFGSIKDEVVHAALPSGQGTFGVGLAYSGEPGIEFWDAGNLPGDTFRTWDGGVSVGYGMAVATNYDVGLTVKGFYQDLYTSSGYGGAVDIGFACRPLPYLRLGATGRNLGFAAYGSGGERMPIEAGIGGGVELGPVNAVLDVIVPMDNTPSVHVGAEYLPVPELAVRLGYRTGPEDLGTLGVFSGLTAGLG